MKRPFPSIEFSKFVISRWFSRILRFQTTKTTTRNTNRLVTIQITSYVSYDIAILVALMPCFLLSNVCVCVSKQHTIFSLWLPWNTHRCHSPRLCTGYASEGQDGKAKSRQNGLKQLLYFWRELDCKKNKWIHLTGGKLRFYFVRRDDFKYSVKICKPKTCRVHLLKYHDYERLYFKLKNSEPYPNGWGVLVYFEHSSHPKKNTAEKRDFGMWSRPTDLRALGLHWSPWMSLTHWRHQKITGPTAEKPGWPAECRRLLNIITCNDMSIKHK